MDWMQVSLSASGELAEAVADVLARFAPNGVVTEQGVRFLNEEDEGSGEGPITVCAYLPVDEHLAETRRSIEDALGHLRMIQPFQPAVFKRIPEQNWMEAWKQHYHPITVGRRLIVMPAWAEYREGERIVVKIDPGMAFGTGTHPTTQLCLEMMETLFEAGGPNGTATAPRPQDVIDVGCGSGILSISALKLGARRALAVDLDGQAIENARHNARINGLGRELELGEGSIDEIRRGDFGLKSADLVLANILAPVIMRLFEAGLSDLVAPGGHIVLGGILHDQADRVIAAAEANNAHLIVKRQQEDWVALLMGRRSLNGQ